MQTDFQRKPVIIRKLLLALFLASAGQAAVADISFSYGFPGFNIGYGNYGRYGGGHFGFFQPYVAPRYYHRHGHAFPRYRGGLRSYSQRPHRHYHPRRFYRPHRFHRFRRY